jgi:hypothetical protein
MQAARTVVATLLVALTLSAGGVSAAQADPLPNLSSVTATESLDAGTSSVPDGAAFDVNGTDRSQERVSVTVLAAPGSGRTELRSEAAIDAYDADGSLTERRRLTRSDTLVVRLDGPGLATAVADQPGRTTTARFANLVDSADLSLTARRTQPQADPQKVLDFGDPDALTVVTVGEDRVYLVADPTALTGTLDANRNGRPDDEESASIETGDRYRVSAGFRGSSAETTVEFVPATAAFTAPDGQPVVYPAPGQEIAGETTVAPGTELVVTLQREDGVTIGERAVRVTGTRQPQFAARFDLQDQSGETPVTVTVRRGDTVVGTTNGTIATLTASVDVPAEVSTRDRLELGRVRLPQNGFVVVRAGGPNGPTVATAFVPQGEQSGLTVQFDRPVERDTLFVRVYADVDGDRSFEDRTDLPFRSDTAPISQLVTITEAVTAVDTTDESDGPTTTRLLTPPTETTEPGARSPTPNGTGVPGTESFTPYTITVATGPGLGGPVALVAIALALLLVRRR